MRTAKIVVRLLLLVLLCALGVATYVYFQTSLAPEGYQPLQLTPDVTQTAANAFINRKIFDEFGNKTQLDQPFDWTLTQQQANEALASMDEIAFQLGGKRGDVERQMNKQGIAGPAVQFKDDRMVLMINSRTYGKVLSLEISFATQPDGRLAVRLEDVRVGRQSVPRWLVDPELAVLESSLAPTPRSATQEAAHEGSGVGMVRASDVGKLLKTIFGAINGQPIRPLLKWPVNHKKVTVQSVELTDGQMTLHLKPIARVPGSAASEPAEPPGIIPFLR
jgi:hypothetical protein